MIVDDDGETREDRLRAVDEFIGENATGDSSHEPDDVLGDSAVPSTVPGHDILPSPRLSQPTRLYILVFSLLILVFDIS